MPERVSPSHDPADDDPADSERAGHDADPVTGRPLSPRGFRPFGIEAVLLGPPATQRGLTRRDGIALWRRLPEHAALFDRVAGDTGGDQPVAVRVVVATTPAQARSLWVPALGSRAERITAAAGDTAALLPTSGCLLLVDEGPGENWLYLAGPSDPEAALKEFIGRRGRTDFARARRRARHAGFASLGMFAALVLIVYAQALGLGVAGQIAGGLLLAASLALLVNARPR